MCVGVLGVCGRVSCVCSERVFSFLVPFLDFIFNMFQCLVHSFKFQCLLFFFSENWYFWFLVFSFQFSVFCQFSEKQTKN